MAHKQESKKNIECKYYNTETGKGCRFKDRCLFYHAKKEQVKDEILCELSRNEDIDIDMADNVISSCYAVKQFDIPQCIIHTIKQTRSLA